MALDAERRGQPPLHPARDRAGINFFDTANVYSNGESEEVVGRALRDFTRRDEVVLATKVWGPVWNGPNGRGLSRKAILSEIDKSLAGSAPTTSTSTSFTATTTTRRSRKRSRRSNDVVRAGKARYLGASSMHAWQFMKALGLQRANGWAPFVSMQNYYNLLYREDEREMLRLCVSEGIGVTPWSPLARGKLTRPWAAEPPTERAKTDAFGTSALREDGRHRQAGDRSRASRSRRRRGVPPAQVAMAWLLRKPAVTSPIFGATKPHHLDDAVAALSLALSDDERARLDALYRPHPQSEAFS